MTGLETLARAALLAVLVLAAAAAAAYAVLILRHPWDWIGGEGVNLAHSVRLADGGELYRGGLASGTLSYPIYPPVIYVVWAGLIEVFGSELWPMRAVTCLAAVGVGASGWLIARWDGCDRFGRAVSALAPFTFTSVVLLAPAARPDMLAIGLLCAGTALTARWEHRPDRWVLALVPLTVLVVFTKHNFAVFPLAWLAAVAWRDRWLALRLAIAMGALGAAALAVTQALSDGRFLDDMRAFSSGFSTTALSSVVKSTLLPVPHPLLAIAAVEAALRLLGVGDRVSRAPALAYGAGLVVVLTGVKLGAGPNYWAPAAAAAGILAGPALDRLRRHAGAAAAAGAAATLALILLPVALDQASADRRVRTSTLGTEPRTEAAVEEMAGRRGTVLSDRHDVALAAGAPQRAFFDPPPFSIALLEGDWEPAALVRAIERRRFALIHVSFDARASIPRYQTYALWPEPVIDAVRKHYCPAWHTRYPSGASAPGVWLYAPC